MDRITILLAWILLLSCSYKKVKEQTKVNPTNSSLNTTDDEKKLSHKEIFDINYKISSIANHKDTSNYIARFEIFPAFDRTDIFEIEELRQFNGLFLIYKTPLIEIANNDSAIRDRGLLFEQNCYWLEGKDAKELIINSKKYFANNSTDTSCSNCLDLSYLELEQNNKGVYTKIIKQYFQDLPNGDKVFIGQLKTLIETHKKSKRRFRLYH